MARKRDRGPSIEELDVLRMLKDGGTAAGPRAIFLVASLISRGYVTNEGRGVVALADKATEALREHDEAVERAREAMKGRGEGR